MKEAERIGGNEMNRILSFVLPITLICAIFASNVFAQFETESAIILQIGNPKIIVNGAEQVIDESGTVPVLQNGRTLLPVRAVVEAMNGSVEWDGATETVTLTCEGNVIRLTIGSGTAYLNGNMETLDTVPVLINGRTMLPIRFIAEGFGYDVVWNGTNSTVTIAVTSSAGSTISTPTPTPSANNEMTDITISVGGSVFSAKLYNNDTTKALLEQLPLTLNMSDLHSNEKYYYLPFRLPVNAERVGNIQTGDLMLYGSDCLVVFYKSFPTSYSYTRLGYIEDTAKLAATLGSGSVQVTFAVK
jgi:hypothetical protein